MAKLKVILTVTQGIFLFISGHKAEIERILADLAALRGQLGHVQNQVAQVKDEVLAR